jgi:hypothetical protein
MNLTKHWTLEELVFSSKAVRLGIDNTPPDWAIENLRQLCIHSLEPLRLLVGKPLVTDSGYRCLQLNEAVGGVTKKFSDGTIDWTNISQHCKGEAADLLAPAGMTLDELYSLTVKNVPFDQAIFEGSWMHLSYRQNCRGQMLTATFVNGRPAYTPRFVEGMKK